MMQDAATGRDRFGIGLFLGLVVVFSLIIDVPMALAGSIKIWDGWGVTLLMWAPGLAAILTALFVHRSFRPLGLMGNRSVLFWAALCLLIPIGYTFLIYPLLQAMGLVTLGTQFYSFSIMAASFLPSLRNALGEELGWRGYASPVFSRVFGFHRGQALLGVVWFLYHLPPLLFTDYGASPHAMLGNILFFLSVMALSFVLAFVRLKSDSVWPSAFFHASHNLVFLHLFDPVTPVRDSASLFIGEQGIALVIVQILLAAAVLALLRRSGKTPMAVTQ